MKYLVVVIMVISSFSLFAKKKEKATIDSVEVSNGQLEVYYGSLINKFNQPLMGISYINFHKNLPYLFEFWTYKEQEPNTWIVVSAAARFYYLKLWDTELYMHLGGGLNLTVLFPVFYSDFGINYKILNIRIRMIPPIPASSIFLTVGLNL